MGLAQKREASAHGNTLAKALIQKQWKETKYFGWCSCICSVLRGDRIVQLNDYPRLLKQRVTYYVGEEPTLDFGGEENRYDAFQIRLYGYGESFIHDSSYESHAQ
eukprot:840182_1